MKNILQIWLYFTYKQTPEKWENIFEKYFTSKKMKFKFQKFKSYSK